MAGIALSYESQFSTADFRSWAPQTTPEWSLRWARRYSYALFNVLKGAGRPSRPQSWNSLPGHPARLTCVCANTCCTADGLPPSAKKAPEIFEPRGLYVYDTVE
jgi:hypothetical protein